MRFKNRADIKKFVKKIIIAAFFLFCLKAVSGVTLETNSTRIAKLEKEIEDLQDKIESLLVDHASPSANPDIMGDIYFFTFDLLYWYARTNGTAFAYSNNTLLTTAPVSGRTKDLDFKWQWGLRTGIGRNIEHDKWDLYGTFTWLDSHVSAATSAGPVNTLIPLRGALLTNAGVSFAKSVYALDTYQIDIELGRHYFISSKLSVRPFVGVKNAWINQQQIIRYTGGALGFNTARVEDNCDYWGLGLRGGLNSKWHLGEGLYLQGLIAGAVLYGFFDIDHREKITSSETDRIHLEDNKHRFIPTVQWRLGLGWGSYLFENQYYIDLSASYEGMYWWRLNQMIKIYEYSAFRYDNYSDDISMHGLTLMLRFYF